ncbi:MAG: hypothetical protein LGB01_01160 [Sulfurovum sp.]|nr:hypothetical protein [Sulfurovum sp.]
MNIKFAQEFGVDLGTIKIPLSFYMRPKSEAGTLVELAEQIKLILNAPTGMTLRQLKLSRKGQEVLTDFMTMHFKHGKNHCASDYHEVLESIVTKKDIGFGKDWYAASCSTCCTNRCRVDE